MGYNAFLIQSGHQEKDIKEKSQSISQYKTTTLDVENYKRSSLNIFHN